MTEIKSGYIRLREFESLVSPKGLCRKGDSRFYHLIMVRTGDNQSPIAAVFDPKNCKNCPFFIKTWERRVDVESPPLCPSAVTLLEAGLIEENNPGNYLQGKLRSFYDENYK